MSMGGYREGSGRSKTGYYNGIYCGSTYELCWVIYSIDHGINFTRFPGLLEANGVRYYPDFLLGDGKTIVETKGYEAQLAVDKKTAVAISHGYVVQVLRKDDLKYAFDYVSEKYGTKRYHTLYDGYAPTYDYICDCCGQPFRVDSKKKTERKFYNRVCAGKFRKQLILQQDDWRDRISASLTGRKVKPYQRKYKQKWITDGKLNTKIQFDLCIPDGFHQGRTNSVQD